MALPALILESTADGLDTKIPKLLEPLTNISILVHITILHVKGSVGQTSSAYKSYKP